MPSAPERPPSTADADQPPRFPRPTADLPIARVVAVLLILLPIGAFVGLARTLGVGSAPSSATTSSSSASVNPLTLLSDSTPHFLPTPVAAMPAEVNAGPPAPAADEQVAAPTEQVKIANTGGAGAILRADPPRGRQVAALRDGTVLQVLEHRQVEDGSEWLRVRTPDGTEGWVFSRLAVSAD